MKNLRGAKNFLIGWGASSPAQLPSAERSLLHRMYGVTEADYPAISARAATTRRREAAVAHRKKKPAPPRARARARAKPKPRRKKGRLEQLGAKLKARLRKAGIWR